MQAMMDPIVEAALVDGCMTSDAFYNLQFKFHPMHDAKFGGHMEMD